MRQRERFTASDRQIRDHVWSFHRGTEPPRISHMFYAKEVTDPSEPRLTADGVRFQQARPALLRVLLSPFMLARVEASGVPAPRQCVSRLTA